MKIMNLLEEELHSDFEDLYDSNSCDDDYELKVESACKLVDRYIAIKKLDEEIKDKEFNRTCVSKKERKNKLIEHLLTAASIAVPALLTVWGTKVSLKFEETGSVTSIMGRGFINKLLPKK